MYDGKKWNETGKERVNQSFIHGSNVRGIGLPLVKSSRTLSPF